MKKLTHNHPFHMVTNSPWPLLTSLSVMILLIGGVKWFHKLDSNLMLLGMLTLILCLYQWWRDIVRESTFQGSHTIIISKLLRMGMVLFIISEIFFFISLFWSFFHMMLSPSIEIGNLWPPKSIKMFDPYDTPLVNTIILLSSGISITWSHYSILSKNFPESLKSLKLTIFLGIYFSALQYEEYNSAPFTMADSTFGSTFFMITGFHGLHVIIGTIFISISYYRLLNFHFSNYHHFGFEASSWYWHFVDVVWLFVYIFVYWWSY